MLAFGKCQQPLTVLAFSIEVLTQRLCALARSLQANSIGAAGAEAIGAALKTNESLTSLKYAAPRPIPTVSSR